MKRSENARVCLEWGYLSSGEQPNWRLVIPNYEGSTQAFWAVLEQVHEDAVGAPAWRGADISELPSAVIDLAHDIYCGKKVCLTKKEAAEPAPENYVYTGVEGFLSELGTTVRECIGCGCLVPGGPTRCKCCAAQKDLKKE